MEHWLEMGSNVRIYYAPFSTFISLVFSVPQHLVQSTRDNNSDNRVRPF